MYHSHNSLPCLDCHAHIAVDVTDKQLGVLGDSIIFAVTRSLNDAKTVLHRKDRNIVWGCGMHPANKIGLESFHAEDFKELISHFALIGEVGLDRRSGNYENQQSVFQEILLLTKNEPLLLSVHSTGFEKDVVLSLAKNNHPGTILHWFRGNKGLIKIAYKAGFYFSVNAAMSDESILSIPIERMLPETDFPFIGKTKAKYPADLSVLEKRLSRLTELNPYALRQRWYMNLRQISIDSGALDHLPEELADILISI